MIKKHIHICSSSCSIQCNNLGQQYQFIKGKCYFFDAVRKDVNDSQENCKSVFGSNFRGKLTEPTSMDVLQEIQEVAKIKLAGDNRGVLTGFMKTDDSG